MSLKNVCVLSLGTSNPTFKSSQSDVWNFIRDNFSVTPRTRAIYQKTLAHASIKKRHFALPDLGGVLDQDLDRKNRRFQTQAVALASEALRSALEKAALKPSDMDFLVVATCTGYVCPGLSSYLIESLKLRTDARTADVVGMGCGAAVPAMEQATNFLHANGGRAAVVCVEVCSAAMVSNDEIDIVISNTIFADGAAAVILESSDQPMPVPRASVQGFSSLTVPEWRDTLKFASAGGHLKNVLGKNVPEQSASATKKVLASLLEKHGLKPDAVRHWVLHAGGARVLDELTRELGLSNGELDSSRAVLAEYGNMSSPTVLYVLDHKMRTHAPQRGDWAFLSAFGAGFSAHGVLLRWI